MGKKSKSKKYFELQTSRPLKADKQTPVMFPNKSISLFSPSVHTMTTVIGRKLCLLSVPADGQFVKLNIYCFHSITVCVLMSGEAALKVIFMVSHRNTLHISPETWQ